MKLLVTSDTHFSDVPKDKYRFGLFTWLVEQQKQYNTDALVIAGDLTTEKNFHSAELVNAIVTGLKLLKPPVFILKGNHDYIREDLPYFNFLSEIEGITFFNKTTIIEKYKLVMVPHQLNQVTFTAAFKQVPIGFSAFTHVTVTGAISESGSHLTGLTVPPNKAGKILSGDIHRPQKIETEGGTVTYIGSPYHCRHGDQFTPRVLLLNDNKEIDLHFPAPKKLSLTIRDVSEIPKLSKGDQVKVTLELDRSEVVEWANHKKRILDHCKDNGIEIYGVELKTIQGRKRPRLSEVSASKSNLDYFRAFCLSEQVPANIKAAGLNILE